MPNRLFRFDDRAGRFRSPSGRFLSASTIRSYIDRTLDNHSRAVTELADQLRERSIPLGEWERRMRQELKQIHLYSGMAAKGGRSQLTQSDFGRIGRALREQYGFLRDFADQIASGQQPIDGRFTARSRLYAQAGRSTFHLVERVEMEKRGWDQEENVLAAAEHCGGCLAETARGRVPIGELVPIGQRPCLSNDRCRIRYSNSVTGEVAA